MINVAIPLRTRNPNNGQTGNSRLAAIIRTRQRAEQRATVRWHLLAAGKPPRLPVDVTITRVAPSRGLDPHDGLGAALKATIDAVAEWLGADDRDGRIRWRLDQRRGKRYEVEIRVEDA